MPPVNHAALSAGIIAVSLVVAAGIAIYESPELRRMAEDLRRRIAIALHSLGDSISPQERENLFNRPEDAEGFLLSRGIDVRNEPEPVGEQGVDADDETRRRQREELMHWNAIAEEKRAKETRDPERTDDASPQRLRTSSRGSSFDDFLQEDASGEKGTYVFHTGTDRDAGAESLRHRGGDGLRGLNHSVYTNPFADEHGIDEHIAMENSLMEPDQDEMEDIYSASDRGAREVQSRSATLSAPPEHIPDVHTPEHIPALVNIDALEDIEPRAQHPEPVSSSTIDQELAADEYMTAGQADRHDAFSSIQAWAQTSNPSLYSPSPVSPAGSLSEPEIISNGRLTPTDSASLAGSGEEIGDEARSATSRGNYYDVMSDDEGMATPASWTEVGSVISESDAGVQPVHA